MGVDLPGGLGDADVALVVELQVDLLVLWVLVGDDGLFVGAGCAVAVREVPNSLSVGLVVGEAALVVGAIIREDPFSSHDLVVRPLPDQLVPGVVVDIGAGAVLLAEHPPTRVDVLVRVRVGAFSMLHAVLPVTLVIASIP